MAKTSKPRVRKVADTFFGKRLADPKAQQRHAEMVQQLREDAREEVEAVERSERLSQADLSVVINTRTDHLVYDDD
jgi:hypothetical protein